MTADFVRRLDALEIKLWVEGDRLRCSAPAGIVTPGLKAELKERKEELIGFLRTVRPAAAVRNALSFSQQRLWFLEQMDPGNLAYNIWGFTWVYGSLNIPALEQAIVEIIRRHDSLRTTFVSEQGEPRYVVGGLDGWKMGVIDLTRLPLEEAKKEAVRLATQESKRSFDLSRAPLFRVILLRNAPGVDSLFVCVHHIISDGLSFGVFFREFLVLYHAFSAGMPSPLPPLPIQYSDFARRQIERWERGELTPQINYWKKQLGGKLPVLALPSDHVRPPIQSMQGASVSLLIPVSLTESLRDLGRRQKTTLFMTLLAAFKTLLFRYTGQDDMIVGTPVSGRIRPEDESLFGFCVNNLVLRTDLSGDPTFIELLARVREVALKAYANQEVPFDKLVEILRPERNLSHPPLFQVLFSLQPLAERSMDIGTASFHPYDEMNRETSRFDLAVDVVEKDGGLKMVFEYNTSLFDEDTVRRFQGHFKRLLESIVARSDQRISELQLLTEAESNRALVEWNGTQFGYPAEVCVHHLIETQTSESPDRIAVQFGGVRWTYRELDDRANRLAVKLHGLGVGPDVLVGVCLERSPLMVLAVMATLKAGGAYVPLDPAFPAERLAFMLSDAKVHVLLTQEHLTESLPAGGVHVLCLDSAAAENDENAENAASLTGLPLPRVSSENLAYVIYTSGSTGRPKGVQITHRALTNFLLSMLRQPGLQRDDRLLSVTTLSFDIAGLELFLPLVAGAQIILSSRSVATDPFRLAELMDDSGATVMQATPATWKMLIEAGWKGSPGLKLLCGGEALSRELADQLLVRAASVWNMYGPTETTIWSTLTKVAAGDGPVSIGRPIANTRVYLLDSHLQPVAVGVAGELFIGGDGLARGYVNRPDLTEQQFIPDPFSLAPAARLYRTGDLARYRPDGSIECLGRVDHQVKIRGFRIELAEIEACLARHPEILQAVVVARESGKGDRRLAAYVRTATGAGVSSVELRDFAKASLPDYMVPAAIVMLDAFPLTPNGKVERNSLPEPAALQAAEEAVFAAPRTALQRIVADLWREVLEIDRVGLDDNFFDLGGHSLLIVKLHSKLRDRLHCELTLMDMFQNPTVAALCILLNRQLSPTADLDNAVSAQTLEPADPAGSRR